MFLCPRRNLPISFTKRKASPKPFRPAKKEVTKSQGKGKKRKLPEKFNKVNKVESKTKKIKSNLKENDDFVECISSEEPKQKKRKLNLIEPDVESSSNLPSFNLFTTLKLKKPLAWKIKQEKGAAEEKRKTKFLKRGNKLFGEWKSKKIDDYMTKSEKSTITSSDMEKSEKLISDFVNETKNGSLVVQDLLENILNDVFANVSHEDTLLNEFSSKIFECKTEKEVLSNKTEFESKCAVDDLGNIIPPCKVLCNTHNSCTTKTSLATTEFVFFDNSISKKNSEESDSLSLDTSNNLIITPTDKIDSSSDCPHQNILVHEYNLGSPRCRENRANEQEIPPINDCKIIPLEDVIEQKSLKQSYSIKGVFPRIKLISNNKSLGSYSNNKKKHKITKKISKNINEKGSPSIGLEHQDQEIDINQQVKRKGRPLKLHSKITDSIKKNNNFSLINKYFTHFKKDNSGLRNNVENQQILMASTVSNLGEESKSSTSKSPEKKPLAELQFSMLPLIF